ncbi:hypothetical protein I553_3916 [Mycobacterium xenopi 4042]|uniref:Uncharacterized protein n=1 Tax=Mycobacterium xenopi 4042 TaxID=1299334 RepID=X8DED3_MYCXE|nr:hypothetical protein I553_3916 [Mycobacterium xenopi 4042]
MVRRRRCASPTLTRAIRCRDSGDEGLGQAGADPVGDSDRLFPMTHARRLAETFPHASCTQSTTARPT